METTTSGQVFPGAKGNGISRKSRRHGYTIRTAIEETLQIREGKFTPAVIGIVETDDTFIIVTVSD